MSPPADPSETRDWAADEERRVASDGGRRVGSSGSDSVVQPFDQRTPSVSDAVTAAARVFRDRADAVVPAYFLAVGTAGVARTPLLVALGLAVALLVTQGRIESFLQAAEPVLVRRQTAGGRPDESPVPAELRDALVDLLTPETVLLIGGGAVVAAVVFAVVRGVATAITQATVWAALAADTEVDRGGEDTDSFGRTPDTLADSFGRTRNTLAAGLRGAGRWQTFLGLFLVKLLIGAVLLGGPLVLTGTLLATTPLLASLGFVLLLGGGLVFLLVLVLLSFAGPAVVVDDAGVIGAIRSSVGFVRRHLGATVGFVLLAGGLYVGSGFASAVVSVAGAGRVGALFVPLVVSPLVDLFATGLYAGVQTVDAAPPQHDEHSTPDGVDSGGAADSGGAVDFGGTVDSGGAADSGGTVDSGGSADSRGAAGSRDTVASTDPEESGFEWVTDVDSESSSSASSDPESETTRRATGETTRRATGETTRRATDETTRRATDETTRRATTRHDSSSGAPTVYKRDRGPLVDSLRALFVGGTRQFGQFAVTHPLSVFLSTVAFVAGTLGGWRLTAPAGVRVPPPTDVARVFGTVPVNDFLNIAANNWLVAVSGVYSGLAFGLPAAVGGAFNGALVGALAGAFDLRALAVLVAPHGVIEIPTLLVAWGVGIHLGGVGWRAVRGRTDAATVAERLQTAAHALAGVAVLLVVASFVEAFLTPQIAAFVLG